MSINRVNISGNLTRDPELRVTASGTQVLSFGVAVNDRRRNPQTGEWEDYPNFVDCTMFGTRAEAVRRYLSKGSKVAIEGKLRSFTDAIADERANRIRVHELLTSVPGIGKAKADDIMRKLGIADNRRVQGLGCRQRELIIELVEKGK